MGGDAPKPRSLREVALPSVDGALDDFIARAHEPARAEAEVEAFDASSREQALRHEVERLQRELARARARPRRWPAALGGFVLGGVAAFGAMMLLHPSATSDTGAAQVQVRPSLSAPTVTAEPPPAPPSPPTVEPQVAPTPPPPAVEAQVAPTPPRLDAKPAVGKRRRPAAAPAEAPTPTAEPPPLPPSPPAPEPKHGDGLYDPFRANP